MRESMPGSVTGGSAETPRLVTPALLRGWPLPEPGGSKYSRGQALVVGGSCTTPGAAMIAGIAALRMGAGRLSLATAEGIAREVAVALPECGTVALPQNESGAITGAGDALASEIERADAVVIGPGLADPEATGRLLGEVVSLLAPDTPVVLDATGATTLPDIPTTLAEQLAGRLVLTPNSGELAHLLDGDEITDDDVPDGIATIADRYGAVVGCDSWICAAGRFWQTTTGDSGLGTSGSGDVVAGAVAGLLSRGAGPVQSLVWGKYVHAAAGDVLAARFGRVGYLAGEIPAELPLVLGSLRGD